MVQISDTTNYQMTFYFPISPNVFCTTWKNRTSKILHFYLIQYDYLIQIIHIWHILSNSLAILLIDNAIVQLWRSKYLKYQQFLLRQVRRCCVSIIVIHSSIAVFIMFCSRLERVTFWITDIPKQCLIDSMMQDTANVVE